MAEATSERKSPFNSNAHGRPSKFINSQSGCGLFCRLLRAARLTHIHIHVSACTDTLTVTITSSVFFPKMNLFLFLMVHSCDFSPLVSHFNVLWQRFLSINNKKVKAKNISLWFGPFTANHLYTLLSFPAIKLRRSQTHSPAKEPDSRGTRGAIPPPWNAFLLRCTFHHPHGNGCRPTSTPQSKKPQQHPPTDTNTAPLTLSRSSGLLRAYINSLRWKETTSI